MFFVFTKQFNDLAAGEILPDLVGLELPKFQSLSDRFSEVESFSHYQTGFQKFSASVIIRQVFRNTSFR